MSKKQKQIANARIGQKKSTGAFKRGVKKIMSEGMSEESATKIMATQYWKKAKAHRNGPNAKKGKK